MFSSRKTAAPSGGYNLTKSLRFRSSASAYLNRTSVASPTNNKIFTISMWVKRGIITDPSVFETLVGGASSQQDTFGFGITTNNAGDSIELRDANVGSYNLITTQVFRDSSAWYHFVLAIDTTQATSTNRVKLYVNGSQVTSFSTATYPAQNYVFEWNAGSTASVIGRRSSGNSSWYFDGYQTEVNFIDSQALTPSSFGSTNATTGVWQPAKYTGTYGTNGFYLPFTNTTSTTTLGYDFSGNSNNFTVNNISLTAGSTYDSMTDVPTLTSATVANYAVMNPLISLGYTTLADGNLKLTGTGTVNSSIVSSTIGVSSGKWYWEQTVKVVDTAFPRTGVTSTPLNNNGTTVGNPDGYGYWADGRIWKNGSNVTTVATFAANDVLGFAFDATNLTLAFYKNNSLVYTMTGLTAASTFFPADTEYNTSSSTLNFGQQPFTYTPPTGYVALNTYNLPTSTIVAASTYFNANLYTGTGANATITTTTQLAGGALIWTKNRSGTNFNWDTRSTGLTNNYSFLQSNTTNAENTGATNYAMTFSNGSYTVGSGDNININGNTFVSYTWGLSAAVSNTNGSITSQVQANTTAGCSVVTYTGVGGLGTVGHGLGVAPSMIMVFPRSFVSDKYVYHASIGAANYLSINLTSASASTTLWNSTSPTSSVFTVNGNGANQSTSTFLAFCFAPIAGFSAFGSYTGNGSTDGTFVYTGFRPKFVLFKVIDSGGGDWYLYDSIRNSYNVTNTALSPNLSSAEYTQGGLDLLSNGFKFRASNNPNVSGANYIYMAFAENPFKNALAR